MVDASVYTKLAEVAKNGTVQDIQAPEFAEALKEMRDVSRREQKTSHPEVFYGAFDAMEEGRPEVIQYLFSFDCDVFGLDVIRFMLSVDKTGDTFTTATALRTDDYRANVLKALLEKALVTSDDNDRDRAITTYITAGADPNRPSPNGLGEGFKKGQVLACAAAAGLEPATVKLIHEAGASFEDALFYAQTRSNEAAVKNVLAYEHKITGKVTPLYGSSEAAIMQKLEELQAAVAELTEKKDTVKELPKVPTHRRGPTR